MDKFAIRLEELQTFVRNLKEDIKTMYNELGYKNEFVEFMYTCVPQGYTALAVSNNTLYLRDKDGLDWHEDYINEVSVLMSVLKAMHHLLPNE